MPRWPLQSNQLPPPSQSAADFLPTPGFGEKFLFGGVEVGVTFDQFFFSFFPFFPLFYLIPVFLLFILFIVLPIHLYFNGGREWQRNP
jgi:hypothetical protein